MHIRVYTRIFGDEGRAGAKATCLCIVRDGSVRVSEHGALDKEYITMGCGDFWGEGSLMEGVQGMGSMDELNIMQYHIDSLTYVELMVRVRVCARVPSCCPKIMLFCVHAFRLACVHCAVYLSRHRR